MISEPEMTPGQLLLIMLVMALMVACEGPVLQFPNTTIEGEDGDTVILSCSTEDKTDLSNDRVEWLFEDPTTGQYKTVHAYFQDKDLLQEQSKDFRNRTSLFKEELSSGICSLRLKVNTSHNGTYHCHVPGLLRCTVTLKVGPKEKNPSQNHQEDTPSPDNPKNDTDGQTNYGAIGGGVVAVVLGIIIALVVYLHLCSGSKANTSQTHQTVSYRPAPPPQD